MHLQFENAQKMSPVCEMCWEMITSGEVWAEPPRSCRMRKRERERDLMGCAADNRWTQAFLLFPFWVNTRDGSAHRQSEGNRWEQEWTSAKSRPLVALSQILAIMLSWLIYVMRVVPRYLFFLLCETGNRDGNHHKTRFGTVFLTCATQRLQPPPQKSN